MSCGSETWESGMFLRTLITHCFAAFRSVLVRSLATLATQVLPAVPPAMVCNRLESTRPRYNDVMVPHYTLLTRLRPTWDLHGSLTLVRREIMNESVTTDVSASRPERPSDDNAGFFRRLFNGHLNLR